MRSLVIVVMGNNSAVRRNKLYVHIATMDRSGKSKAKTNIHSRVTFI